MYLENFSRCIVGNSRRLSFGSVWVILVIQYDATKLHTKFICPWRSASLLFLRTTSCSLLQLATSASLGSVTPYELLRKKELTVCLSVHFWQPVNIFGSLWQVVIFDNCEKLKSLKRLAIISSSFNTEMLLFQLVSGKRNVIKQGLTPRAQMAFQTPFGIRTWKFQPK